MDRTELYTIKTLQERLLRLEYIYLKYVSNEEVDFNSKKITENREKVNDVREAISVLTKKEEDL